MRFAEPYVPRPTITHVKERKVAPKGILFDLDGTLLDTYALILASFRHATSQVLGHELPEKTLMAKVGMPLVEEVKDFTDDERLQADLVSAFRSYNQRAHDGLVRAFPGVEGMLRMLAPEGLRLGVVTSKRGDLARRGLQVCGLGGYFEFAMGSDEYSGHKPDPAPVLYGCERLGLSPQECVYVGDSPFDIAAGNAAGCATVAVTWGMFGEDLLLAESPSYVVHDPLEVCGRLGF